MLITILSNHVIPNIFTTTVVSSDTSYCSATLGITDCLTLETIGLWNTFNYWE